LTWHCHFVVVENLPRTRATWGPAQWCRQPSSPHQQEEEDTKTAISSMSWARLQTGATLCISILKATRDNETAYHDQQHQGDTFIPGLDDLRDVDCVQEGGHCAASAQQNRRDQGSESGPEETTTRPVAHKMTVLPPQSDVKKYVYHLSQGGALETMPSTSYTPGGILESFSLQTNTRRILFQKQSS
jgi:hypothetical protein